jgi:hypothetical protein
MFARRVNDPQNAFDFGVTLLRWPFKPSIAFEVAGILVPTRSGIDTYRHRL